MGTDHFLLIRSSVAGQKQVRSCCGQKEGFGRGLGCGGYGVVPGPSPAEGRARAAKLPGPAGRFLGPVVLKEGTWLASETAGRAVAPASFVRGAGWDCVRRPEDRTVTPDRRGAVGFRRHGASLREGGHVLCHQKAWERRQSPTVRAGKLRPGSPLQMCLPIRSPGLPLPPNAGIPETWPLTAKREGRTLKVQHLRFRVPATPSLNRVTLTCRGHVPLRSAAARFGRPPAARGRCKHRAGASRPTRGVSPAELGVALPNRHAARHVVSPEAGDGEFQALLDIWFPEKQPLPTAFLVDTSEEALLLPDWLKLRMIRSEVPRLVDAALQDLEPQQLLLFVQSFGIPVSSMSKLLQYLDQAVAHDPQTLEQNIMDKNYMAHLVEVQHERGASGGQTFHSLLTASLPPRRDGAEAPKPKSSPEQPSGQGRTRAVTQVRVLGPEDDLAGTVLQIFPLSPGPRWQSSSARPVALALQQALGQELAQLRQGSPELSGVTVRLLQAVATLLGSPHGGALVMSMHRNHFLACPLLRQISQYQRCVPQDTGFSSLFLKVLVQMLQWLDGPAGEGGPLQAQLKLFAAQYSARRRISDARSGLLRLAEALAFRGDSEVVNSTVRAVVATLRSGEKCGVEPELVGKVLRGLIEAGSPHLEELLAALFATASPTWRPVAVLSSLLLQEKEPPAPGEPEADSCSPETVQLGPCSGLLVDWLELLDPEVIGSCPDLQQRLLFSRSKGKGHPGPQVPSFRPYLLALLTHQSSWSTLHQCIRILLGKNREQRFDPSASLDFLWACIHVPRIWQGRDQRTPQKRREELALRVRAPELVGLAELILAEAEARSQDGDAAACGLLQARLPLLLRCCRGDDASIRTVTAHLTGCVQQWGDSVPGRRCRDLLVQLYLQWPELRAPVPEALLHSGGATGSSTCKLDGLIHRVITLLADTSDSRSSENRVADANMACRKLAVAHPILLLRHLPMIAALLHGRTHLNFQEFRQQNHLTFFLHVLGVLELLQPQVFQSEHQGALWDCLRSFVRLLLSYRKSSRHLAPFIHKFVHFTHKYVTCNAPAAVSFLQKHADALHDLSFDSSDLVTLKSLLAGLSLPSRDGRADRGLDEEGEDESSAGSLPLVSVSLSTPLTAAEMAPYMKRLSRGQAVEDLLEVLSDIDEMSRRRPEILGFFSTSLQRLMSSAEEPCRHLAFGLALRSIQNNPSIAADFLPTFMYCLGSRDFEVVQTALRNLPEYTLLCQEHAAVLLHRAFLVGMYGQMDTSVQISEALRILHMEAVM
ncbi:integrator complex subunit 1 [Lynx canadensis]|uniref:integrator complex subunit 1 n=1 Tax=Lynx canadensis TaxID=61383 RepID=UPI0013C46A82|nr:integrator complex subunit 1 [Lynx canadensis]